METDAKLPSLREQRPWIFQIVKIACLVAFIALVLLLGLTMANHRFFQGEREHPNGSVGQ